MLQTFDERNRDLIVNVNGALVHRDQAGVSPFDSVVQGGDAVWEGLRLYDGRIFALEEHLERLEHSAKALAFASIPSRDEIVTQIRRTLEANGMTDGVHLRLTLTRGVKITSGMDPRLNQSGHTLIVLAEYKAPVYDKRGLSLITSSIRRFSPDQLDPKIHHNNLIQSIMAKIEANHAGADDALMLDARGFVAETNATHLFIVERGTAENGAKRGPDGPSGSRGPFESVVRTSRTVACPEGVTRRTVIEICDELGIVREVADLSLVEFYRADECFCTGTMGELAPVTSIDGRPIGGGGIGPMTERLSAAYAQRVASGGTRVVGAGV